MKIEQFGGNPTSLVTAIGNSLAFCSLSSIEGCSKVITNIKNYITSPQFESQPQHDKWNTRVISDIDSEPIISEIDSEGINQIILTQIYHNQD